ncbi:MAG: AMIN domain-containing protein [Gemmatimonadetes bacterium]|nr:AMIN domain-containing protein [Gemmatimonadota bacterium]
MILIAALWAMMLAERADVTALSVIPVADRTAVVIAVQGPVSVQDFLLPQPDRLVIDIAGAQHVLRSESFRGINRGGVLGLRLSQFSPQVVRVVVELDQPVTYTLERRPGEIRVSFPNRAGPFSPWSTGQYTAPLADAPLAKAAAAPLARQQGAQAQEPRITVSFRDTPILDVLATFSEFAGRSIVPGAALTGVVTAEIRDQPWSVALEAILQSQGLAAQEQESGIIRVDQVSQLREFEKLEEVVTQSFPIQFTSVDSIKPSIEGLVSEGGKVTVNRATNTLLVTDKKSVVENRIGPVIRELDRQTPQVTIAAKILFIDRTALEDLGIIYDLKDSRGNQLNRLVPSGVDLDGDGKVSPTEITNRDQVLLGGNSIAALANAVERVPSASLQILSSLVLGRHSLITFIEALEQMRLSDIQAAPVVTTLDHREASVQVGERTPIRVVEAGAAGAGGGGGAAGGAAGGGAGGAAGGAGGGVQAPLATVKLEETGIILRVTPHVTGNKVLLDIHAERSNIALAPSDIGFTFQTQQSDTQVLVNDGETAVISGLTIIETNKVRSGIPFLMDLPVLGTLFRRSTDQETKKDLLIMVTPHILRES